MYCFATFWFPGTPDFLRKLQWHSIKPGPRCWSWFASDLAKWHHQTWHDRSIYTAFEFVKVNFFCPLLNFVVIQVLSKSWPAEWCSIEHDCLATNQYEVWTATKKPDRCSPAMCPHLRTTTSPWNTGWFAFTSHERANVTRWTSISIFTFFQLLELQGFHVCINSNPFRIKDLPISEA